MNQTPTSFSGLVEALVDFINLLIPAIFAVVFIYFVYKILNAWVLHADEESAREEGRQYVIAAVIAFVVMISAWGIVAMFRNSVFGA